MALFADYHLAVPRLPLVDVAGAVPDVTLQLAVGQPNQGAPPPFVVRAAGEDLDEVERAFGQASFVAEYARMDASAGHRRYRIVPAATMLEQLGPAVDRPAALERLAGTASVVESITVTPEGWRQVRWFADREAFDEYWTFWRENAAGFTLYRLSRPAADERGSSPLTGRQREALATAYEMGYFEIPRRASLRTVASELGITASSLSERLRRAQQRLVAETLAGGSLDRDPPGAEMPVSAE